MFLRGKVNYQIKKINLNSIFQIIAKKQPISRVDIAEECGFSKSTISSYVDTLLQKGLVVETNEANQTQAKGRPKLYLRINEQLGVMVSIYRRHTGEVLVWVTDPNGKTLERNYIRDHRCEMMVSMDDYIDLVGEIVASIKTRYSSYIHGLMGVSLVQGIIFNPKTGITEHFAQNKSWVGKSFKDALIKKNMGIPIYVMGPAFAASHGETTFGSINEDERNVFMVGSWGLGIAYYDKSSDTIEPKPLAASFSHSIMSINGKKCVCGNNGCLEAYASLWSIYNRLYPDGIYTSERYENIFVQNQKESSETSKYVDEMWDYFAVGVLNCLNAFHPQTIVIGGRQAGLLKERHLQKIRNYISSHAFEHNLQDLRIIPSKLIEDGPSYGGIAIVQENLINHMVFDEETEENEITIY